MRLVVAFGTLLSIADADGGQHDVVNLLDIDSAFAGNRRFQWSVSCNLLTPHSWHGLLPGAGWPRLSPPSFPEREPVVPLRRVG
jgi:hypothetical protein